MKKKHIYVGMDVHKETIVIALAEGGRTGEIRSYGTIPNDLRALEKVLRKLRKNNVMLHFVYEAGPCGYVIQRRLTQLKEDCTVIAPSLIPKKSGDKIKTDKRDAISLARLHRAGELTEIYIPNEDDEAIRDLVRARTDSVQDSRRSRQQLKLFLLRHGYKYTGRSSWNEAHMRYLREIVLKHPAHKVVLEEYLMAITTAMDRIERIEEHILLIVPKWKMYPVVQALMNLKGFRILAATVMAAELGDIRRFEHPRQLMAYLGLVVKEHTSGESKKQGGITKTGNKHARWFLIESAQHYKNAPKVGRDLSKRQEGQKPIYKEISWKAQNRLYTRYWTLVQRGVHPQKATVAVARELAGFIWDLCHKSPIPENN